MKLFSFSQDLEMKMKSCRSQIVYADLSMVVLTMCTSMLTKRDRVLPKGELIGSVHSVGAVIPMVKVSDAESGVE